MSSRSVSNDIQIPVPLNFPRREIRGNLMRVIEIHRKYGAKENIIVENLWKLHQYQAAGYADYVPNFHPVFKADKQGADIASGMTDDQKMYQACFRELYKEKPTAVVNQLFFYDKADDTSYETHVAVKEFLSSAEGTKLIVNPTPDTARFISNLNQDELTVSVADEALAGLYSHEMPNVHFVPFKSIGLCLYDSVLLFIRNEAEYPNWTGYSALNYISDKGLVMISAPEAIIKVRSRDNNFSSQNDTDAGFVTLRNRLSINSLHVEKILLIPNSLTQSHPKAKRLIVCRKGTTQLQPVRIYNSLYKSDTLTISSFVADIAEGLIWSPDQSLMDNYNHQLRKEKATSVTSYSNKRYYDYSPEIRFRFTLNPGRKNYRTRATLLGHKTQQSLINPPIEKGLASSSPEEAISRIEQVLIWHNDEVREKILSDLFQSTPLEIIRQYSLKTLWYIHRPVLQGIPGYDDNYCFNVIFSAKMKHFSSIFPFKTYTFEEYRKAYNADKQDIKDEQKFWKQIEIILNYISGKLKITNPVSAFYKSGQQKTSPGIQSSRNMIALRSFSIEKAKIIWKYIMAKDKNGYLYRRDPVRILVAIRLVTGIPLTEILALDWGKTSYSEEYGTHLLYISCMVDDKNNRVEYSETDPDRIRIFSIPPELYNILSNRRNYLKRNYPFASYDTVPVIIDYEPKSKNKKQFTHMSISSGGNVFRKIKNMVSDAPQPVELEATGNETDFTKYGGDIFNANHEFHMLNNFCNPGSLKHMYGFFPETTVERHYIDYENAAILDQTAQNLSRWISSLTRDKENDPPTELITGNKYYSDCIRLPHHVVKIRLTLKAEDLKYDDKIFLTIKSGNSVNVAIR